MILRRVSAVVCAGVVATGVLLAGCGSSSSAASASSNGASKTIDLYYTAPLTGGADVVGIQGCDGEKLAVSDINAAGGVTSGPLKGAKFSVSCLDNGGSADTTSSIAAKYVSQSNVWALSGFYASGNALAAAIVAERAGLPVIASNVGADFLTTKVHNVFVVLPRLQSAGGAAMDFCKSYYGATKVAALVPDYSYIPNYMQGATAAGRALGMHLVSNQTWPDGKTTDWSPYWTKLSGSGAQCVLLGGYPPEQCQITAQGRQLGMAQPVIDLTDSFTGSSCQKQAGPFYAGMIFGNMLPAHPSPSSLTVKVGAEYQKQFGQPMSYYAADGYDSVLAVEYAVEQGATSRTDLIKYLAKASGPGVGGPISFTNNRIGLRYLTFEEANSSGGLAPVGEYEMYPNGTYKRVWVSNCSKRPTCQTNLGSKA